MLKNTQHIEHTLSKMRLKKSVCLTDAKKTSMLSAVLNSSSSTVSIPKYTHAIPSPFTVLLSRFVMPLALPVFALFFVTTQYGQSVMGKFDTIFQDFKSVKSDIEIAEISSELKSAIVKNNKDIVALKAQDGSDKSALTLSVVAQSKSIRNQVASLVKENKITEAKQIVLTLETALKADELYKVATSVSETVFATTDLRLDLERQEVDASLASTTVADIEARIKLAEKTLSDMEPPTASTTDNITTAKNSLIRAKEYVKENNIENAIITLQVYDRIVAELKHALLR
jgi:hypothetical protein